MIKSNLIAIDLAKNSFHVCKYINGHAVLNKEMTRAALKKWLAHQKPTLVAMEACSTSHYWGRFCLEHGHTPFLVPTAHVKPYRIGHKTDESDTFAIASAAQQPRIKPVAVKTADMQALQVADRTRKHFSDNVTATFNMIRAFLMEFGLVPPKGNSKLRERIPDYLEDGENDLPGLAREHIFTLYQQVLMLESELADIEKRLGKECRANENCKKLMKLEGVGPVNAVALYLSLGSNGGSFKNGREASACIGLTPKQYSTGGKVTLLGISKRVANKRLRSNLIQGAMAVVKVVDKRVPRNQKEAWIKSLIGRGGLLKAAVALANKTVRTAWAMLHHNTEYRQPEMTI